MTGTSHFPTVQPCPALGWGCACTLTAPSFPSSPGPPGRSLQPNTPVHLDGVTWGCLLQHLTSPLPTSTCSGPYCFLPGTSLINLPTSSSDPPCCWPGMGRSAEWTQCLPPGADLRGHRQHECPRDALLGTTAVCPSTRNGGCTEEGGMGSSGKHILAVA